MFFALGAREARDLAPLDAVVAWIRNNPGARLVIEGHTDASGSAALNQRLSVARANTIRAYLVERSGARASMFQVKGKGESELAYPDAARNRRVVIRNR